MKSVGFNCHVLKDLLLTKDNKNVRKLHSRFAAYVVSVHTQDATRRGGNMSMYIQTSV